MTPELIAILTVGVTPAGFIRPVHRDLSDPIARVEKIQAGIRGELAERRLPRAA